MRPHPLAPPLPREERTVQTVRLPVGLSALCATVLGAPLDKRCCLSNWGRRPLAVTLAVRGAYASPARANALTYVVGSPS